MMKKIRKVLVFLLVLLIAAAGTVPAAADAEKAQSIIDGVIDYNLRKASAAGVQQWIDGSLTENAGQGSEWYVIALSGYGNYDFSRYESALLGYLSQNEVGSASSRLKYALTLAAVNSNSSYISEVLDSSIGEQGIMSLIFGLHVLNNGFECDKYSVSELRDEILSLRLADGGWSLSGTNGDVDVTAMAVQVLAPHYSADNSVKNAVDAAIIFLSERQQENGGYSSYGVNNPESAAQVLVALSALGIDAATDSRFFKNGKGIFDALALFELPDGSFCHKEGENSNSTATVQVFYSAVSYKLMKSGGRLYIFEKKETPAPQTTLKEAETEKATEKAAESSVKTTAEFSQNTTEHTETQTVESTTDTLAYSEETTVMQTAENMKKTSESNGGYKKRAILAIAAAAIIACVLLVILKKNNAKNFIFVALIAAAGILVVLLTDITLPENYYGSVHSKENSIGTVTMSIRCDTVAGKNAAHIPENGTILDTAEFEIENGDSVYDILLEASKKYEIHVETSGADSTVYVEGIANIYELDFGDLSGWMYWVNGSSPTVSCGEYELSPGDEIEWFYTCDMGMDIPDVHQNRKTE